MEPIIDFLAAQYMFDMWVFTRWLVWAPLGIPAVFYGVWFLVKWAVFTAPLWIPLKALSSSVEIGSKAR